MCYDREMAVCAEPLKVPFNPTGINPYNSLLVYLPSSPSSEIVQFSLYNLSKLSRLSADRPFTESETTFLKYIRQWGKKVVFVVNKVDILSNDREVEEVTRFVANSATRLLGVDRTQVNLN